MDVEAQIKLNELAKDLVKKGLAPSSEDAAKMAETIIGKKLPEAKNKSEDQSNALEKYEIMLERSNRKMFAEIESLKEQLKLLSSQFSFIADEFRKIKREKVQNPEPIQKVEAKTPEKSQIKKETNEPFTKEDVAIDKIFYFGKK